jgi:hypothetical protein
MASTEPKVNKQGTVGKRKHITLISQKLETYRRLEIGDNGDIQYWIISC